MLDPPQDSRVAAAVQTLLEVQAVVAVAVSSARLHGCGGVGGWNHMFVWMASRPSFHRFPHTPHTQDDGSPPTTTPRKQHQQQLRVTPLGYHLAALPCPVRLGKMLVYGAVLGVLGPTLRYESLDDVPLLS